jgi:hypothetical protein
VLTLAEYVAQEPVMGPIAPAEFFTQTFVESEVVDQVLADELGEGEGLGNTLCSCICGGDENLPPTIVTLGFRVEGDFLVIFGDVQDDQLAAGYLVAFTGLTAEQATTDEDGHFELRIALPLTSGFIYARATDLEGAVSDEVSSFFDPE